MVKSFVVICALLFANIERGDASSRKVCYDSKSGLQGACVGLFECHGDLKANKGCPAFESCCTHSSSCGGNSNDKISYFVNPPNDVPNECENIVTIINKNVCQVRLDFEQFVLAQPVDSTTTTISPACMDDNFSIDSQSNVIPKLCGINTNEHLYAFIKKGDSKQLQLRMQLANRLAQNDAAPLDPAKWRIRITQIECSGNQAKIDQDLMADYNCLQFYSNRKGIIETFNYNQQNGPYMGAQTYNICFKKYPIETYCGIEIKPIHFQIGSTGQAEKYDSDCTTDYLRFVPSGNINGAVHYKVCDLLGNTVTMSDPAIQQYNLIFHSEDKATPLSGFRLEYKYLTTC